MSTAKERLSGCLSLTFATNLSRLVWATIFHSLGIVLTVINLAVATSGPKEALSWAKFDVETPIGKVRVNWGLLKYQACDQNSGNCEYLGTDSVENGTNFIEGGRGVITACTFAMFFALIAVIVLWLWIAGLADKLKVPRIILNIANFLSLTLYIVAISTYYKLSYNHLGALYFGNPNLNIRPKNLMPGYSIALGIVVIVCSFFAWGFSFWRVCRPNKNEPARAAKPPKAAKGSAPEPEVATSTSALDTAKAQQTVEPDVEEGQPGSYESSYGASKGGYSGGYGGSYGNGNAYNNDHSSAYSNDNSSYGGAYNNNDNGVTRGGYGY